MPHSDDELPNSDDERKPLLKKTAEESRFTYRSLFHPRSFSAFFTTTVGSVVFAPYGFSTLSYQAATKAYKYIGKYPSMGISLGIIGLGIIYHNMVEWLARKEELIELKAHCKTLYDLDVAVISNTYEEEVFLPRLIDLKKFIIRHETMAGIVRRHINTFLHGIDQTALIAGMWQVSFLLIQSLSHLFTEEQFSICLGVTSFVGAVSAACNADTSEFEHNVPRLVAAYKDLQGDERFNELLQKVEQQIPSKSFELNC